MKTRLDFIKTTVLGGVVFIVTGVIVVIALGKLIGVVGIVAKALSPLLGIQSFVGGLVLEILAFTLAVFFCFAAELLAKRATAKRVRERLDRSLLNTIPGYTFIKGSADNLRQTEGLSATFLPVIVPFDDYAQTAFETERQSNAKVAVYLPRDPNPLSGSVVFVSSDRVKPLAISLAQALRNIRSLGEGRVDLANLEHKTGTAQVTR